VALAATFGFVSNSQEMLTDLNWTQDSRLPTARCLVSKVPFCEIVRKKGILKT